MAQVDLIVMGNQPTTTYIDLDNPARPITGAPGSRITPPEPAKKRRGRPPGSKNRTQPEAAEKEHEDG